MMISDEQAGRTNGFAFLVIVVSEEYVVAEEHEVV
jgi:hypothetical protein